MPFLCLQLKRKAKMTAAVSTIGLPSGSDTVNPGMLCSVAGWGLLRVNGSTANKLQEVELEVQRDEECKSRYEDYNTSTQMCVGNPRMKNSAMEVSDTPLCMQSPGHSQAVGTGSSGNEPCPCVPGLSSYLVTALCPWGVNTAPQSQMGGSFLQEEQQDCQFQDETSGPTRP